MNRIEAATLVTVRIPFLRSHMCPKDLAQGTIGIVVEARTHKVYPRHHGHTLNSPKVREVTSYRVIWEGPNGTTFTRWMRASSIKVAR